MSKELEALEKIYVNEFYDMTEEFELLRKAITELETLRAKEVPIEPLVSIIYENDTKVIRANCKKCGAMVYQTSSLYALKEVLGGERPYCQHCGQHLSNVIELDEDKYCNSI